MRFFHSRLDNEPIPIRWRYYVGAALIENDQIVKVSRKPILKGSEHDEMSPSESGSCRHYKQNVVFPCGAIEHKGGWILSVGINDAACGLVKIEEKDLNL